MEDRSSNRRRGERGFALVLAILSLMLLTFLGLTMAATTSTELQIATNYRWSQQALYNAEAGLEAARVDLTGQAGPDWSGILPPVRPGTWLPGEGQVLTGSGRDYERNTCEGTGGDGVGYGRVLAGFENSASYGTDTVNGAFTVWVRRPLLVDQAGMYSDEPRSDRLVIVAEGVAPYTGGFTGAASALLRARQAVRVLETRYLLGITGATAPCGINRPQGQEGGSPMGENFNPCVNISAGANQTLGDVFGAGGGSLGAYTQNR